MTLNSLLNKLTKLQRAGLGNRKVLIDEDGTLETLKVCEKLEFSSVGKKVTAIVLSSH